MSAGVRDVFVDRDLSGSRWVTPLLDGIDPARIRWVEGRAEVDRTIRSGRDPFRDGKRVLYLTRHRGDFLKRCPASPGQVCCGYWVLNLISNCPFDCTYCILQSYLDVQPITVFANFDDALAELAKKTSAHPDRMFRIGTGELGDSLALEPRVPLSRRLITAVAPLHNVLLELKTKSANVDDLLGLDHAGNAMISWSLGTERRVRSDEPGTVPVSGRIAAARRAEAAGYRLGFHFDPMIRYDGWEEEFRGLIDTLFSAVDPSRVVWISLGCLRFPPALKETALERFDRTKIYFDEFVPCPDGKMRYLRTIREEMYGKVVDWIREGAPSAEIYLCMESPLMWENVFGLTPDTDDWLSMRLDRAAQRACPALTRNGDPAA
jgi:spore photoproduct lyase